MTLFGGTAATWNYKLWNENYAPYTSLDIEVLQSNTEPELILYNWGHDPRTSDVGDNITHVHRLGIIDWIPKMHQLILSAFSAFADDSEYSARKKNFQQVFLVLVGVMQRAGYYPFTQVIYYNLQLA